MKAFMYKLNILIFLFLMLFAGVCYAVGDVVNFGSDLTTLKMQELMDEDIMYYNADVEKYIFPFSIGGGDGFYELTINGRKVNKSEIYLWDGSNFLEYEGEPVEDNEGRAYFEFDQFNAFSGTGNYFLFIDPEDVSAEGVITEQWIAANLTELEAKKELEAEQMEKEEEDPSVTNLAAKFIMSIAKVINYSLQLALKQPTTITIDNIVFNEYEMTKLDFFSNGDDTSASSQSLASILRDSVNACYNVFFSIAIVGYFAILVYVGIKMLLKSTNASERASYKTAFFYWLAGLAILFLMPFYMKYTIYLNDAFVKTIANSRPAEAQGRQGATINSEGGYFFPDFDSKENPAIDFSGGDDYMSAVGALAERTNQIGVAIAYLLMTWQLIVMCVYYYKRVFMTAFLIIIFPLIGLTYVWDKLNDGKSQALSAWITEFTTGVFVQSFHAIIFCFVTSAIYSSLIVEGDEVKADFILLMIASSFMFQGEIILRQIFTAGRDGGKNGAYGTLASTAPKIAATGIATARLTGRVIKNTVGATGFVVSGVRNFQSWRRDRLLTKRDSNGMSNFEKLAVHTEVQTRQNALLPADPNIEITPEIKLAAESTEILNNMENHTSEEISKALQTHKRLMQNMKNMDPETRKYVEAILKRTKYSEAQLDRVDRAMVTAAVAASNGTPTKKIMQNLRIEVELAFPPDNSENKKITDKVYRATLINMKNNIVSRGINRQDIEHSWNGKIDTIDEISDKLNFATKDTSAKPDESVVRDRISKNTVKIQKQLLNNFKRNNIALTEEQKSYIYRYAGAVAVAREAGTGIFDEDTGNFNELQEANDILHHDYQFGNNELRKVRDENINIKALEKSIANKGKVSRKNKLLDVRANGLIEQYKEAMGGEISEDEEKILQKYTGRIATLEQLDSGEFSAYDSYRAISGMDSVSSRLTMTEEEMTANGLTDYEKEEVKVVKKLLNLSSLETDLDTYKYVIAKKIHSGGDAGPDRRVFKKLAVAQFDESRKWAASTVESMETRAFNMFKDSNAYIQGKREGTYPDKGESVVEEFYSPARGGAKDEEINPVVSIYNIIAATNGMDDTRKGIANLSDLTQHGAYTTNARSIIDDMNLAARSQNQKETNAAQDFATEALDIFDKENPKTDEINEQLTYNGYTYDELLEHQKASFNGVKANATGVLSDIVTMPFGAVTGAAAGMAFSSDGMPLDEAIAGAAGGVTAANMVTDGIVNVVDRKDSNAKKVSDIEDKVKKRLGKNDRLKARQAFEDAAYANRDRADTYLELKMATASLFVSHNGQLGATVFVQAQNAEYVAVNETPAFTWEPYQEQINYMFKNSDPDVKHNLYIYVKDDSGNIQGTQLLDLKL